MAESLGTDHVQICRPLHRAEEGSLRQRWVDPLPKCLSASQRAVLGRSYQVLYEDSNRQGRGGSVQSTSMQYFLCASLVCGVYSMQTTVCTTILLYQPDVFTHPAQAVTLDVEDLEADATPEDLMLSYVSGEKGKVCICVFHAPS